MRLLKALDLHGYKVEEVFDAIERFINEANTRELTQVKIMPGKGSGKVRDEAIRYLKLARYHWQYEKLKDGRLNEGVIMVFL